MCINYFNHYTLCSHGVSNLQECIYKQANRSLDCEIKTAGTINNSDFCPRPDCQQKNREIEEANERDRKQKEEEAARKGKGWGIRRKLSITKELIKRDARGETPNPFTKYKRRNPSTSSAATNFGETEHGSLTKRNSLPVRLGGRVSEPCVGDILTSNSAPVRSFMAITEECEDIDDPFQDNDSAIRPQSDGNIVYDTRGGYTSNNSGTQAQAYRNLVGKDPHNAATSKPPTRDVRKEKKPEHRPSYKHPTSPTANLERRPSQSHMPQISSPLRPSERAPFQPQGLITPKRESSQKKEPQLYQGQPQEREILYTDGKQRTPMRSQKKAPPPAIRRQVPSTAEQKEFDRMSVMTTISSFIPVPLEVNVESRREGAKLPDGTYDHRRLNSENKIAYYPNQPTSLSPARSNSRHIRKAEFVSPSTPSPRPMFAGQQSSVQMQRSETSRSTNEWLDDDDQYVDQGGNNQEVSPSTPFEQQHDHRFPQGTSSNHKRGHGDRGRDSPQILSPSRTETPKHTYYEDPYVDEYKDTQEEERYSPQTPRRSPQQTLDYSSTSPDDLIDAHMSEFHSPQDLSSSRDNSFHENPHSNDQFDSQVKYRHIPQDSSSTRFSEDTSYSHGISSRNPVETPTRGRSSQKSSLSRSNASRQSFSRQQKDGKRRGEHPQQHASPPRMDMAKQSLYERTPSDAQGRGERLTQDRSPQRSNSSKQTFDQRIPPDDDPFDTRPRGEYSSQNQNLRRTDSSKDFSHPKRAYTDNQADPKTRERYPPNNRSPKRTHSPVDFDLTRPESSQQTSHLQRTYTDNEAHSPTRRKRRSPEHPKRTSPTNKDSSQQIPSQYNKNIAENPTDNPQTRNRHSPKHSRPTQPPSPKQTTQDLYYKAPSRNWGQDSYISPSDTNSNTIIDIYESGRQACERQLLIQREIEARAKSQMAEVRAEKLRVAEEKRLLAEAEEGARVERLRQAEVQLNAQEAEEKAAKEKMQREREKAAEERYREYQEKQRVVAEKKDG